MSLLNAIVAELVVTLGQKAIERIEAEIKETDHDD